MLYITKFERIKHRWRPQCKNCSRRRTKKLKKRLPALKPRQNGWSVSLNVRPSDFSQSSGCETWPLDEDIHWHSLRYLGKHEFHVHTYNVYHYVHFIQSLINKALFFFKMCNIHVFFFFRNTSKYPNYPTFDPKVL